MVQQRFSHLSAPRQALIRNCQRMGFGKIVGLTVCGREPVFGPGTEVLSDVKLNTAEISRPELGMRDFVLRDEMVRLFAELDSICNGVIEQLEIREGIPVRMTRKTIMPE